MASKNVQTVPPVVPNPAKPASMKDVAKLAGVSQTTVSFVLNKVAGSNISTETQARVWAAIEELGYRPNAMARQLRSSRTHTIGFISDVVATTPFAGQIIQGAQDGAWEHGYLLLVVNTGGNQEVKQAAVNTLLERRVDGILYATMYHRSVDPPTQIREVPTVLLDCYVEDRSLPSVVPDEVNAGRVATNALIRQGHTRIAYSGDIEPIPANSGRFEGYRQALDEAEIPFDSALVTHYPSDQTGGYSSAKILMALAEPPTAIFCFNDRKAMGTYQALAHLGKSIPDDVAIVGFDNQELIAPFLHPPLTTMELPHYEMGQWAIQHLLGLIESPDTQNGHVPVQHFCECPLIERSSI